MVMCEGCERPLMEEESTDDQSLTITNNTVSSWGM